VKKNKQATKYKKLKVFGQWTRNERRGGVEPGERGNRWGGIVDGSRRTGKGSYFNKTRLQTKKEGRAHAQGGRRRKGPGLRVEKRGE